MAGRRINGGVYGAINSPSRNKVTGGIWSSAEAYNAKITDSWPTNSGNSKTVMLLKTSGLNGAQNNTFADSSLNSFSATRNGNVTQGTFGPYGSNWSVSFDGAGDYLTGPGGAALTIGTNDFTIEFFVNLNAVNTIQGLVDFRPLNGTGIYPNLYLTAAGTIVYDIGEVVRITSTALSAGVWYHVAVCRSNSVTKMFLNGVQVGNNYTDTNNYIVAASRPSIGASGWSLTYYTTGLISNLHVTSSNVGGGAALYTSNFVAPLQNITPIASTVLLCCASSRFRDLSTNNHTITPSGNAAVSVYSPFVTAIDNVNNIGSMYFDGTGDYLNYAAQTQFALATGDFTIEFWLYKKSVSTGPITLFDFRPTSTGTYTGPCLAFNANGNVLIYSVNGTVPITINTVINTNAWHHVALVKSSNVTKIYIDGVAQTATYSDTITYSVGASRPILGADGNVSGSYGYTGHVSDLRVIKGTAVYTTNFTPPTSALTAITNTSLLLNCKQASIYDAACISTCETVGNAQSSTNMISAPTGNSIYFDGTGDYITSNAPAVMALGTVDFTIECWVNVSSLSNSVIIDFRSVGNDMFHPCVYIKPSGKLAWFHSGADRLVTTSAIAANNWYHVAVVRTTANNLTKIYINGIADATTYTDTNSYNVGAARPIIGLTGFDSVYPMLGLINDLRITKGRAVYTTNFVPPTDALPKESDTVLLLSSKQPTITDLTSTNTLTVVGDTKVIQSPRKVQRSVMYFDGTGDYLTFDGKQELALGAGDFTIEAWICPTALSAMKFIFDYRPASVNGVYPSLYINASNKLCFWVNNADRIVSTDTLVLNSWYHIAIVKYSSLTKMFINGKQAVSTYADTNSYLALGTGRPSVAASGFELASNYAGYIEDVRVVKGKALYKSNFAPPVQPLTVI